MINSVEDDDDGFFIDWNEMDGFFYDSMRMRCRINAELCLVGLYENKGWQSIVVEKIFNLHSFYKKIFSTYHDDFYIRT